MDARKESTNVVGEARRETFFFLKKEESRASEKNGVDLSCEKELIELLKKGFFEL